MDVGASYGISTTNCRKGDALTLALEIVGFDKRFDDSLAAQDLSLTRETGVRHALLIGPDGGGETTVTRSLAGAQRPNAGWILLEGRDIPSLSGVAALAARGRHRLAPNRDRATAGLTLPAISLSTI